MVLWLDNYSLNLCFANSYLCLQPRDFDQYDRYFTTAECYARSSESKTMVNGPLFVNDICISAPKIPVCTLSTDALH